MSKAVGSLETRPWLPDGLSVGWTHTQPIKLDEKYRGQPIEDSSATYVEREGPVVIVFSADRDTVIESFDSIEAAEKKAKKMKAADWQKLVKEALDG